MPTHREGGLWSCIARRHQHSYPGRRRRGDDGKDQALEIKSILKDLKWRLLLQIHDEVILEGPKESRDEAMAEVRACMENPYDSYGLSKLDIFLDVDAKSEDSWYKAK
jgi:DNA polymerase I-like protein with 3'-5' exonuclease and polymerase domains